MGKYIKSEYHNANGSLNSEELDVFSNNLNNLLSEINSLSNIAESKLEGKALNIISSRIEAYSETLKYVINEKNRLISEMIGANNSVINKFTDEYDELSDEYLEDIEAEIAYQKKLKDNAIAAFERETRTIFNAKKYDAKSEAFNTNSTIYDIDINNSYSEYNKISGILRRVKSEDTTKSSEIVSSNLSIKNLSENIHIQGKLY